MGGLERIMKWRVGGLGRAKRWAGSQGQSNGGPRSNELRDGWDSSAHPAILYLTPVHAALLSSPPKPLELPRVGFAEKPPTALSCASPHTIDCVYLHTYRATAVLGRPMQSKDV